MPPVHHILAAVDTSHSVSIIDQMQIANTLDISIHSGGQIRLHAHYRSRADSYLVLHQHYCWCEERSMDILDASCQHCQCMKIDFSTEGYDSQGVGS